MCFVANGYIRPSQRRVCAFVVTYALVVSIRRGSNRGIPANSVKSEKIFAFRDVKYPERDLSAIPRRLRPCVSSPMGTYVLRSAVFARLSSPTRLS